MAIDNMIFALHVADQRKKLVDTLKDKGVEINDDTTLSVAIDRVKKLGVEEHKPAEGNGWKVTYFDIDGTILKEEYVTNGGFPTPPPNPTYDNERLRFVGWADLPEIVTHNSYPLAIYETIDEATYIDIVVSENNLEYSINFYRPSSASPLVTVDWGDGTTDTNSAHTYSSAGEYTIKIFGVFEENVETNLFLNNMETIKKLYYNKEMKFHFGSGRSRGLFYNCELLEILVLPQIITVDTNSLNINSNYWNKMPLLKTLYCPENFPLYQGFLSGAISLVRACMLYNNITMDNYVTGATYIKYLTLGSWNCGSSSYISLSYLEYLKITGNMKCYGSPEIYYIDTLVIEEGVTHIAFASKYIFPEFKLPSSLVSLKVNGGTQKWKELILPEGLETLEFSTTTRLESCYIPDSLKGKMPSFSAYYLKKIKIPKGITSLSSGFLQGCRGIEELIIMPNKLLSLSNTFKTADEGVIWVNDEVIEQYKTATNWSAHADKMRPLSEKPID